MILISKPTQNIRKRIKRIMETVEIDKYNERN